MKVKYLEFSLTAYVKVPVDEVNITDYSFGKPQLMASVNSMPLKLLQEKFAEGDVGFDAVKILNDFDIDVTVDDIEITEEDE